MSIERFFTDLDHAIGMLGIDQLADRLGASVRTLHRYLKRQTTPQPRMILKFYQETNYLNKVTKENKSPALQSEWARELMLMLWLRPSQMEEIERIWGTKGRKLCTELLREELLNINEDRCMTPKCDHQHLAAMLINSISQLYSWQGQPKGGFIASFQLNAVGISKLQELCEEFHVKLKLLQRCQTYQGQTQLVWGNLLCNVSSLAPAKSLH